jgi:hypothetical protein
VGDDIYDVFVSYARAEWRHAMEIDSALRARGLKPKANSETPSAADAQVRVPVGHSVSSSMVIRNRSALEGHPADELPERSKREVAVSFYRLKCRLQI